MCDPLGHSDSKPISAGLVQIENSGNHWDRRRLQTRPASTGGEVSRTIAGKNCKLPVGHQVIAALGVDGSAYRSDYARTGPGGILDPQRLRRTPGSNFSMSRSISCIKNHSMITAPT
jgi:hypothetical protein